MAHSNDSREILSYDAAVSSAAQGSSIEDFPSQTLNSSRPPLVNSKRSDCKQHRKAAVGGQMIACV